MLKKLLIALLIFSATFAFANDATRQALNGAINSAKNSIQQANFGTKTVSILPIKGDRNGTVQGRLKNLLSSCGVTVVEGKDEPMLDEIFKETAWNERKDDILDSTTLVKFGKLKATQILIYGKVVALDENSDRIYAEIELHATDLATKQHIWGGNFAYRFYKGKDIQGIVSLDNSLRMLLKQTFAEAKKSLEEPMFASKLNNIKTVTVIPLSGDIDQYMTGLAIEILSQTRHIPQNPQIPSLTQVRAFMRDGQLGSDAILYGAIRDLKRTAKPMFDTDTEVAYEVNADIQLFLEEAKTGNILWSKTITLQSDEMVQKNLSNNEKLQVEAKGFFAKNWKTFAIIIGVIAGIIALGIAVGIIRSATNVR